MQSSLFFLEDNVFYDSSFRSKKFDRSRHKINHHPHIKKSFRGFRAVLPSYCIRSSRRHIIKFTSIVHEYTPARAISWFRQIPLNVREAVMCSCLVQVAYLASATPTPSHTQWFDFILSKVGRFSFPRDQQDLLDVGTLGKLLPVLSTTDKVWMVERSVRQRRREEFLWWSRSSTIPKKSLMTATVLAVNDIVSVKEAADIFKTISSFREYFMFSLFKKQKNLLEEFILGNPSLSTYDVDWALSEAKKKGVILREVKVFIERDRLFQEIASGEYSDPLPKKM